MVTWRPTSLVHQSVIPTTQISSSANQLRILQRQIVNLTAESLIPFTNTSYHVQLWIKRASTNSPTSSTNYPHCHQHSPASTEHWTTDRSTHHSNPESHHQSSCSHTGSCISRRTQTPRLKEDSMTPNQLRWRHQEGRRMAQGATPLLQRRKLHR